MKRPALALLFATCAGCAAVPIREDPRTADLHLVAGRCGPEVGALAKTFYGTSLDMEAFGRQLQTVLARDPTCGEAHEIAGYWATLQDDDDAAWEQFARAAADTNNPDAAVALRELSRTFITADIGRGLARFLREVATDDPNPELRTLARGQLLNRDQDYTPEDARADAEPLGYLRDFQVAGAFDNDQGKGFETVYPPEVSVDLTKPMQGSRVQVRWRPAPVAADGSVPLGDIISPNAGAVAYLVTWIHSDAARPVEIRLGTSAPVAVWLDGAPAASDETVAAYAVDNVIGHGMLAAGWNELLIKSAVKKQYWRLQAHLTDPHGEPLHGLTFSGVPQASPRERAAAPPPAKTATDPRGEFLEARQLALTHHADAAAKRFSDLEHADPACTLLRYDTALADFDDGEVERAVDLADLALRTNPGVPGLLLLRAQIHAQKQLFDQAERDLEKAISEQPHARRAMQALSGVLDHRSWENDRAELLRKALRRWPSSSGLHEELAEAVAAQGYLAQAARLRAEGARLQPGYTYALARARDAAASREDYALAEKYAQTIAEVNPYWVANQLAQADLARRAGEPARAEAILRAVAAQDPDDARPYVQLAKLAQEQGKTEQALALWSDAHQRSPDDTAIAERLDHLRPPKADALAAFVPTDAQIEQLVKHAPAVTDPAAHAEQLLCEWDTLVNADGSAKDVVTLVNRALDQDGRDALVRYHLGNLKSRVLEAYAIAPDGTRSEASSITHTDIRFRALEVGSTVVIRYVSYAPRMPALNDEYFDDFRFGAFTWGALHDRWVVLTGHGRALKYRASPEVKVATTRSGDWDVHIFTRDNIAALAHEPHMAPVADIIPVARITTMPSWDGYVAWEKALLLESFPEDPKVDALARKLTGGIPTPSGKLDRLFQFVAQEIRYQQDYETIIAGWQPHRSSVVLERKYGDCKDKATLLIALARSVGIHLDFAVLATHSRGKRDRSIAYPDFNHAIVYVPAQKGIASAHFMDPTVDALDLGNLREDDQGARSLVLDVSTGAWKFIDIPFQSPDHQSEAHHIELEIASPESAHAVDSVSLRGTTAAHLRVLVRSERQAKEVFQDEVGNLFPGGTLVQGDAPDHENFTHPLHVNLQIDASAAIHKEGNHFRLAVPGDFPLGDLVSLRSRETPLDLGPPSVMTQELHAKLGPGLRLLDAPDPVQLQSRCFTMTRAVQVKGAELVVTDAFERTCTEVAVGDYAAFRSEVLKARAALDQAVVFAGGTALKRPAAR